MARIRRTLILFALLGFRAAYAESANMAGESLVLAGTTPGNLCFDRVVADSVTVRNTYDPAAPGSIVYELGRDYVFDVDRGMMARTASSRIPDFAANVLYGQTNFDHSKFPGYGNGPFFVYVDYATTNAFPLTKKIDPGDRLDRALKKLETGGPFKIVTCGDSISAGGEASALALRFDERFAASLRSQYPKSEITVENGATGGDSTINGLARLDEKVLSRAPDLVLVGFGMNDHNVGSVPPETFEENLVAIVESVRTKTGADVILFSAFPPNPEWKHSSHRMEVYAAATQRAADRSGAAFADVFAVWQRALQRKDLPSLLANNINHPNDFGHWLYYQALASINIGGSR